MIEERGNIGHPNVTQVCHFHMRLKPEQSDERGWICKVPVEDFNAWEPCSDFQSRGCTKPGLDMSSESFPKPVAWTRKGLIQNPTNQNEVLHRSMTCKAYMLVVIPRITWVTSCDCFVNSCCTVVPHKSHPKKKIYISSEYFYICKQHVSKHIKKIQAHQERRITNIRDTF